MTSRSFGKLRLSGSGAAGERPVSRQSKISTDGEGEGGDARKRNAFKKFFRRE
jgi:hypothetical protein